MAEHENRFSGMTRAELEKEARKQIIHSGLLALTALIVIVVACYAWFCSAGSVTATGMLASLGNDSFELASEGQLPELGVTLPEEYETMPAGDVYTGGIHWTLGNQIIQWRMTGEHNFSNMRSENQDAEGIRPGTSGTGTFYVIPREDGPLSVVFNIEAIPMESGEDNKLVVRRDHQLAELLRGHLMFAFYRNGSTVKSYLSEKGYTVDFGTVVKDTPIQVMVDWYWPKTMPEIKSEYENTLRYLRENHPDWLFYEYNSKPNYTEAELEDMYNAGDTLIGGDDLPETPTYVLGIKLKGNKA